MIFEFCLGLRTADFLFSIHHIASNTVHRDILFRFTTISMPLPQFGVTQKSNPTRDKLNWDVGIE